MPNGKITISKVDCNYELVVGGTTVNRYIAIQIVDEKSNATFIKVKVAFENFTAALTGLARQECEFELKDKIER